MRPDFGPAEERERERERERSLERPHQRRTEQSREFLGMGWRKAGGESDQSDQAIKQVARVIRRWIRVGESDSDGPVDFKFSGQAKIDARPRLWAKVRVRVSLPSRPSPIPPGNDSESESTGMGHPAGPGGRAVGCGERFLGVRLFEHS